MKKVVVYCKLIQKQSLSGDLIPMLADTNRIETVKVYKACLITEALRLGG